MIKKKKDDSDAATNLNLSWSKSICNPKMGIMRTRGPLMTIASFQRWTIWRARTSWLALISPNDKSLNFHMVGWEHPFHPDSPAMIGWTIGDRVHWKSSARKEFITTKRRGRDHCTRVVTTVVRSKSVPFHKLIHKHLHHSCTHVFNSGTTKVNWTCTLRRDHLWQEIILSRPCHLTMLLILPHYYIWDCNFDKVSNVSHSCQPGGVSLALSRAYCTHIHTIAEVYSHNQVNIFAAYLYLVQLTWF